MDVRKYKALHSDYTWIKSSKCENDQKTPTWSKIMLERPSYQVINTGHRGQWSRVWPITAGAVGNMGGAQPKTGTQDSGFGFLQMETRLNSVLIHTHRGKAGNSFQNIIKLFDGISSLKEMSHQLTHIGWKGVECWALEKLNHYFVILRQQVRKKRGFNPDVQPNTQEELFAQTEAGLDLHTMKSDWRKLLLGTAWIRIRI